MTMVSSDPEFWKNVVIASLLLPPIVIYIVVNRSARLFTKDIDLISLRCIAVTCLILLLAHVTVPNEQSHRDAYSSYHPVGSVAASLLETVDAVDYGVAETPFMSIGIMQFNSISNRPGVLVSVGMFGNAWCVDDPELHELINQWNE